MNSDAQDETDYTRHGLGSISFSVREVCDPWGSAHTKGTKRGQVERALIDKAIKPQK